MSNLLSIKDAALQLKLSPVTVRRLIKKGAIKAQKLGKQYRISPTVISDLINPEDGE